MLKKYYIFIYFRVIKSNNKTNLFLSASQSSVVFAGSLDWTLDGMSKLGKYTTSWKVINI